ncbi:hypothetical protein L4X63_06520 [Geomonas sp. Red32]|uniref:hypothetical protein n=1 Tax=Geomonas sp. Red32 TaxID=2912856 RepID=UPI00202CE50D|nr:hypothetical protein [Geomonas sp. Red32]MCM0081237.1 hypothetical protein [Geomonas sp. Red32]
MVSRIWSVIFVALVIAGCGGGGSSSPAPNKVNLSGLVSIGPVNKATVKAWGLDANGKKTVAFAVATSASNGSYTLPTFEHNGSILIETKGGTYKDTAGATVDNPGLKAVIPSASGSVRVPVTPLTHLAFSCASSSSTGLTAANIAKANATVTTAFGIDVTNTSPIDATDHDAVTAATTTTQQVQYGVAIAAVSKVGMTSFLSEVKPDLLKPTPQLSATTEEHLITAINDLVDAGTLDGTLTAITTATSTVTTTITNNANSPILVSQNANAVANAKQLVTDLRNTALSFYNYTSGHGTGGMNAVLLTPYNALSNEVQTKIQPELAAVVESIGWVTNFSSIPAGTTVTGPNGNTLTITDSGTTSTFTVKDPNGTTIGSGTFAADSANQPTTATINGNLTTPSGTSTVTAQLSGITWDANQNITGLSVYGSFVTKDTAGNTVMTVNLGSASNQCSAHFTTNTATNTFYMTSLSFNGSVTSATTQITGSISMPSLVFNPNYNSSFPTKATVTGTIKALNTNGLILNGTLQGDLTNAATMARSVTASSFPIWDASFTGSVVANTGLNVSTTLTASSNTYDVVKFTVQFQRVRPDGTKFTLSGTGTYDGSSDTVTAQVTNQDGLAINLNFAKQNSGGFSGNITVSTTDTTTVALLYMQQSVPCIKFADNYFESVF